MPVPSHLATGSDTLIVSRHALHVYQFYILSSLDAPVDITRQEGGGESSDCAGEHVCEGKRGIVSNALRPSSTSLVEHLDLAPPSPAPPRQARTSQAGASPGPGMSFSLVVDLDLGGMYAGVEKGAVPDAPLSWPSSWPMSHSPSLDHQVAVLA